MKSLYVVAVSVSMLVAAGTSARPGDQIEPKKLKHKVWLTLGSEGTIQFKQQGDELTKPKLVKNADKDQPGIWVEFNKQPNFLGLALKHRFSKALRYRAAMRLKGEDFFTETNLIVPIRSGLISYEAWQDPIEELILFDFKLTDEKS